MIFIAAKSSSPRLQYIAEVLFENILNKDYQVITFEQIRESLNRFPAASLIYYSTENNYGSGSFVIPDEGLLFEKDIKIHKPIIQKEPILKLRFSKENFSDRTIDFDLLSSAFYLITEYEKYSDPKWDNDGRYDEARYELDKGDYHSVPVLNEYAELLWEKLIDQNHLLQRHIRKFDYCLSFDIDAPYLYKGRSIALQMGGALKELFTLKLKRLAMRLCYYANGKDPFDVYDFILSLCKPEKLLFFFLLDRKHPKDGRYTYQSNIYQSLIKYILSKGIKTGIHPSYTSYTNPSQILFETSKLKEITSLEVSNSRMHFLKYKLPDTYRYLLLAGIKDDYTSCNVHSAGFKHFMALPFKWFDLANNKATDLTIHPTMVMDMSLKKYLNLNPEESLSKIKNLIELTHKYKGHFTLLFHNNTLSEEPGYEGWRKVFIEIAKELRIYS